MESPKYNRTFHFPFSPGATNDDKIATSMEKLIGVPIILTEKMDGSNTSLESRGCFARTHAGAPTHKSFDGLKALHAKIGFQIPPDMQFFGEWCYAKHSIEYSALPGYFLLFGIRELDSVDSGFWYAWEEVEEYSQYFEIPTVPVLFKGQVSSEKELKELVESFMNQPSACGGIREGVVARVAQQFVDNEFSSNIMKCVRANHVQTSEHWKDQEIIRNKLRALDSP
jgi:RNA ligase-like protein